MSSLLAMASTPARREPVQDRSRARVARILDSAAEIVEAEGLAATTTKRIAARAGVSVGSLYQFFPDRDAILNDIVRRHVEAFATVVEGLFATVTPRSWQDAVDSLVDAYVSYYRTEPAFRTLWFESRMDPRVQAEDRANNAVLAAGVAEQFAPLMPGADAERLPFVFAVAVEIGDALLDFAFRTDPGGDERVVEETKLAVRAYLAAAAPAA
jgi:AcrR family transcriptional regulator